MTRIGSTLQQLYDRHLLPHVLELACSADPIETQRAKVVPLASGRVLEIGIGSGRNLPYYDRARVQRVVGVEPAPEMRKRASSRAADAGLEVDFMEISAEGLPLDDASFDTVLVTFTLCTIPDVSGALAEMRRALAPGGKLLFCEHGQAPDSRVKHWQDRATPLWKRISGGCHLNRPIHALVEQAGFELARVETMYLPKTPRIVGFNYWGEARPTTTQA